MPAHLVAWIKRPILQSAQHHMLLGNVQRPFRVVVQRKVSPTSTVQSEICGFNGPGIDPRRDELVVPHAVHTLFCGGEGMPDPRDQSALHGPVSCHPMASNRRRPKNRLQGRQALPCASPVTDHRTASAEHHLKSIPFSHPRPRLGRAAAPLACPCLVEIGLQRQPLLFYIEHLHTLPFQRKRHLPCRHGTGLGSRDKRLNVLHLPRQIDMHHHPFVRDVSGGLGPGMAGPMASEEPQTTPQTRIPKHPPPTLRCEQPPREPGKFNV